MRFTGTHTHTRHLCDLIKLCHLINDAPTSLHACIYRCFRNARHESLYYDTHVRDKERMFTVLLYSPGRKAGRSSHWADESCRLSFFPDAPEASTGCRPAYTMSCRVHCKFLEIFFSIRAFPYFEFDV